MQRLENRKSGVLEAAEYSAIDSLRGGAPLEIRALKPGDREDLIAAVGQISTQSLYRRFFAVRRHFTEREIASFVDVDFVGHVALVACVKESGHSVIVGGSRYVVTQPATAEVAFAVIDRYQGLGVGTNLLRHLIAIARAAGIRELIADVLADNRSMLHVFESSGLRLTTTREADVIHIKLRID